MDIKACLESSITATLVVASDIPDALAFGRFNISAEDDRNWMCSGLSYLHDATFGQFMINYSMANPVPSFDALSFAYGFSGHVFGDMSGFYSDQSNAGR
jgi:hypothetical protein